jgi:hypothetical protein
MFDNIISFVELDRTNETVPRAEEAALRRPFPRPFQQLATSAGTCTFADTI